MDQGSLSHNLALSLSLVLTACQSTGGTGLPAPIESADSTVEVVVANQQSGSASLLGADGTMKHVPVGSGPHEAAISRDGKVAVVTIYGTQVPGNGLAVIDLVRDSVIRTIDLGQYARPHGAAFLAGSADRLAVTSEASSNVVLVNLTSGAIEGIPTNARASHMIAVTADGTRGFTANVIDNSVSEIDLAGKRFVRSFTVPALPEGIAVTPDGKEVWVGSNQTGTVTVISAENGRVTHALTGALFPYRLGASPDGKLMAVVDGRGNKLHIADVATHRYTGAVELSSPRGVVIQSDNRTAYVTLAAGSVAVVDLSQLRVLRTIAVQSSPDGVAVGVRR
jgi:DNA-binding beta-propeller fold protein YncE